MSTRTPTHHHTAHILLPSSPSGTSHTSHTLPYPPNACACHTPCGHIQTTAILSIIYTSTSRQLFHVALGVERPCQNLSWRDTTTLLGQPCLKRVLGCKLPQVCMSAHKIKQPRWHVQNQVYMHMCMCAYMCTYEYIHTLAYPLMELIRLWN